MTEKQKAQEKVELMQAKVDNITELLSIACCQLADAKYDLEKFANE